MLVERRESLDREIPIPPESPRASHAVYLTQTFTVAGNGLSQNVIGLDASGRAYDVTFTGRTLTLRPLTIRLAE